VRRLRCHPPMAVPRSHRHLRRRETSTSHQRGVSSLIDRNPFEVFLPVVGRPVGRGHPSRKPTERPREVRLPVFLEAGHPSRGLDRCSRSA